MGDEDKTRRETDPVELLGGESSQVIIIVRREERHPLFVLYED